MEFIKNSSTVDWLHHVFHNLAEIAMLYSEIHNIPMKQKYPRLSPAPTSWDLEVDETLGRHTFRLVLVLRIGLPLLNVT